MLLFSLLSCKSALPPLNTVDSLNLEKYSGLWYDYAHLPAIFLDGCTDITAEYKIENDSYVSVYNHCVKSETGKESDIKGKAFVINGSNNAKLKVQFFWPFRANYWILAIDKDYQYALVGGPSRKYLWILTRTTKLDSKTYNELIETARSKDFKVENMIRTLHQ